MPATDSHSKSGLMMLLMILVLIVMHVRVFLLQVKCHLKSSCRLC